MMVVTIYYQPTCFMIKIKLASDVFLFCLFCWASTFLCKSNRGNAADGQTREMAANILSKSEYCFASSSLGKSKTKFEFSMLIRCSTVNWNGRGKRTHVLHHVNFASLTDISLQCEVPGTVFKIRYQYGCSENLLKSVNSLNTYVKVCLLSNLIISFFYEENYCR